RDLDTLPLHDALPISLGVIDWTSPENGVAPWVADVEVQVADGGEDGSVPATQFFSINVTPVNDAPTVTSTPSTSATEGATYQYQDRKSTRLNSSHVKI